jgi:hypothetical protein
MDYTPPLHNQLTRMVQRPVPHDGETFSLPIRPRRASFEHFVEALEAKAPVPAWRAVSPHVTGNMREEMILWAIQAGILRHSCKQRCMLDLIVI